MQPSPLRPTTLTLSLLTLPLSLQHNSLHPNPLSPLLPFHSNPISLSKITFSILTLHLSFLTPLSLSLSFQANLPHLSSCPAFSSLLLFIQNQGFRGNVWAVSWLISSLIEHCNYHCNMDGQISKGTYSNAYFLPIYVQRVFNHAGNTFFTTCIQPLQ